jgi:hypothetical protein
MMARLCFPGPASVQLPFLGRSRIFQVFLATSPAASTLPVSSTQELTGRTQRRSAGKYRFL